MPASPLTPGIEAALEDVRAASQRLVDAAAKRDADAIDGAVQDRGLAVRRLEHALAEARGALTQSGRQALTLAGRDLQHQAAAAESALREVLDGAREALSALARGAEAARGYAEASTTARAIDRSG